MNPPPPNLTLGQMISQNSEAGEMKKKKKKVILQCVFWINPIYRNTSSLHAFMANVLVILAHGMASFSSPQSRANP